MGSGAFLGNQAAKEYIDPYPKGAVNARLDVSRSESQLSIIDDQIANQQRRLSNAIETLRAFADGVFGGQPETTDERLSAVPTHPGSLMRLAATVDRGPSLIDELERQIGRFSGLG